MINLTITPGVWLIMIILAVIIDYIIGDPKFIWHPVQVIGALIKFLNTFLNRGNFRKFKGFILVSIVLSFTFSIFYYLQLVSLYINYYVYLVINIWFLSTAIANKSLKRHCRLVKRDLDEKDLDKARTDLAMVVGRETQNLNKPEIIKAVVETEAESCIDGIISPLYFMSIGIITSIYIPGLNPLTLAYLYKAINTLDSMVAYRVEPYKEYGYFSAIIDDIFNFIPARIGSYLMLFAGGLLGYNFQIAYKVYQNDKMKHLSPNAGHAEAVMSGLLGVRLGGPNVYFGQEISKPFIGINRFNYRIDDISDGMKIDEITELLFLVLIIVLFFVVYSISRFF